jgi:hypothetical protein
MQPNGSSPGALRIFAVFSGVSAPPEVGDTTRDAGLAGLPPLGSTTPGHRAAKDLPATAGDFSTPVQQHDASVPDASLAVRDHHSASIAVAKIVSFAHDDELYDGSSSNAAKVSPSRRATLPHRRAMRRPTEQGQLYDPVNAMIEASTSPMGTRELSADEIMDVSPECDGHFASAAEPSGSSPTGAALAGTFPTAAADTQATGAQAAPQMIVLIFSDAIDDE